MVADQWGPKMLSVALLVHLVAKPLARLCHEPSRSPELAKNSYRSSPSRGLKSTGKTAELQERLAKAMAEENCSLETLVTGTSDRISV